MNFEKPIDHPKHLDAEGELGPGDWEDDVEHLGPMVSTEIQEQQHNLAIELEDCSSAREVLDVLTKQDVIYSSIDGTVVNKDALIDLVFALRNLLEFPKGIVAQSLEVDKVEEILRRPEVNLVLGLHDALIRLASKSR